jgi:glycosidase
MPDLAWTNSEVADAIAAAAEGWLARGVDGFRLDAVRYLVETGPGAGQQDTAGTHAALAAFAASVRAIRPDALVVGEAWADLPTVATYYGKTDVLPQGGELPLAFDFPLADAVAAAVERDDARGLAAALDATARTLPAGTGDAPFLTNHDQVRIATRLGGDRARLGLAAAILLTLQGTPFVYYGEELGARNGSGSSDENKRAPMAWDGSASGGFTDGAAPWFPLAPGRETANVAVQTADPGSLLSRYRALIRARKASPALARGGLERLSTEGAGIVAYLRTAPAETVLVAHGVRGAATSVPVVLPAGFTAAEPLFVDAGAELVPGAGAWSLALPGRGSGAWRLR